MRSGVELSQIRIYVFILLHIVLCSTKNCLHQLFIILFHKVPITTVHAKTVLCQHFAVGGATHIYKLFLVYEWISLGVQIIDLLVCLSVWWFFKSPMTVAV